MSLPERIGRAMLHELHVGRFRGFEDSDHYLHKQYAQLARMSEGEVWQNVGEETRQSFLTMAEVAARVMREHAR